MLEAILDDLTDTDLYFSLGDSSLKLGDLLVELGKLQYGYTVSFETFKHDWSYQNTEDGLSENIDQLKAWFTILNARMDAVIMSFNPPDFKRKIDRSNGVVRTVEEQLEIYSEAMLIFFGKLVIYFQVMTKPLPPSIQHYIQ